MKKILILLVTSIVVLAGCGTTVFEATSVYTVPEVPAQAGGEVKYETAKSGNYVIGQSPSEYVTGNEVEFTTSDSGKYTCGTDFPAGTYDIVANNGYGNVMSSGGENFGLNEIMGTEMGATETYDNYTFVEGEVLEVSGTSVTLVPQTNDTVVIEEGTYDLFATSGYGNVMTSGGEDFGLNEIMGTEMGAVEQYDNYTFVEGEELHVSGVTLEVVGELPPTEAVPAYDVTETATHDTEAEGQTTTCTTDVSGSVETVDCDELKGYDALKADLEAQVSAEQ